MRKAYLRAPPLLDAYPAVAIGAGKQVLVVVGDVFIDHHLDTPRRGKIGTAKGYVIAFTIEVERIL